MAKQKYIRCMKCMGTGKILEPVAFALSLRAQRVKSGKSLREVARKMNISAPYLSDLERGKRTWTDELVTDFRMALYE